jgi:hypothetical protein
MPKLPSITGKQLIAALSSIGFETGRDSLGCYYTSLPTHGRGAEKDSGDAKVLIDLWPADAFALSQDLPILKLIACCVKQARIPGQWDGDSAPVDQRDR